MNPMEQFLQAWKMESATTLKVLKAYPSEKADFKPHERSQTAKALAWNFVLGQVSVQQALDGTFTIPPNFPSAPQTWQEIINAYQTQEKKVLERLENVKESDLLRTVKFMSGPGDMKDFPIMQFLWFIFSDGIHHRGQFSVYLRMAGGKVPSIYGPSADEPWM